MKLPKILNICGHQFKIVYKKGLVHNQAPCWGMCDTEKQIIYLVYGMSPTKKMEIFLHECLHAIETIYNLNLSEIAVKQLSLGILSAIRDNKIDLLKEK